MRFLSLLPILLLLVPSAAARQAPDSAAVPPPWELGSGAPDEPDWAPLLRIRAAEPDYRGHAQWWGAYAQLRAQAEAAAGNHAAALHYWDAFGGGPDRVGTLPEGARAVDAVPFLVAAADTAQVVMVNERHHAASDRLLTLELLPLLYERGYRYLAAEAFSHDDMSLNVREYPVEATGHYVDEPVFASLVREALRLGYTLVPYEIRSEQREADDGLTPQQRRDRAQAQNLHDAIFRHDPDARVLVHAGFGHIEEEASERWHPMALYLREITGIDPLTVDQTRLSERSTPAREHPLYRAALAEGALEEAPVVLVDAAGRPLAPPGMAVDVGVLTPRTASAAGRPGWMTLGGRRAPVDVAVPACADRWCHVEARAEGEPPEAVPLDRAEVEDADTVRLFLPPGEAVTVRAFAEDGTEVEAVPLGRR